MVVICVTTAAAAATTASTASATTASDRLPYSSASSSRQRHGNQSLHHRPVSVSVSVILTVILSGIVQLFQFRRRQQQHRPCRRLDMDRLNGSVLCLVEAQRVHDMPLCFMPRDVRDGCVVERARMAVELDDGVGREEERMRRRRGGDGEVEDAARGGV